MAFSVIFVPKGMQYRVEFVKLANLNIVWSVQKIIDNAISASMDMDNIT